MTKISKISAATKLRDIATKPIGSVASKTAKKLPIAVGQPQDAPHAEHIARAKELREGGWTHHKTAVGKFWRHAKTSRVALTSKEALAMHRATRKPL